MLVIFTGQGFSVFHHSCQKVTHRFGSIHLIVIILKYTEDGSVKLVWTWNTSASDFGKQLIRVLCFKLCSSRCITWWCWCLQMQLFLFFLFFFQIRKWLFNLPCIHSWTREHMSASNMLSHGDIIFFCSFRTIPYLARHKWSQTLLRRRWH